MMQTYTIKPLEWEYTLNDGLEAWSARCPVLGDISVTRNDWNGGEWSRWMYKYCDQEYCSEDAQNVDGPEEGKSIAEKWRIYRLEQALNRV